MYILKAAATESIHAGGLHRTLVVADGGGESDACAGDSCQKLGQGETAGYIYIYIYILIIYVHTHMYLHIYILCVCVLGGCITRSRWARTGKHSKFCARLKTAC